MSSMADTVVMSNKDANVMCERAKSELCVFDDFN